jgi:intracellular sulfur oxidation DsrE/DsrF family protein
MDKDNQFSEEQMNAFVDGELDTEEKSRVFNESERSTELDQRLCQQRKLKELVKHAYLEVPPPSHMKNTGQVSTGFLGKAVAAGVLLLLGVSIGLIAQRYISPQPETEILSVAAVTAPVGAGKNYILHVVSGEREAMLAALRKAQDLLDSAELGQTNKVEIVANQQGLNLLRSDVTPFATEIATLQESNVVFYACSRTIELLEEKGIDVSLVPDANQSYTALDRVVLRMQDDWDYIKL